MSMPSYSCWATTIVRRAVKPSLRLASCCSVLVVNGASGCRCCSRCAHAGDRPGRAVQVVLRRSAASTPVLRSTFSPSRSTRLAVNVALLALAPRQLGLERPVLDRDEGLDLALAIDDHAHGDGLHAPGGQAAPNLAAQEVADRVADQAVEDAARLLGVDAVHVDAARIVAARPGRRRLVISWNSMRLTC